MKIKRYLTITWALILFLYPIQGLALVEGDDAPDFSIVTIEGKEMSYNRDVKGKKPLYLTFWATW